MTLKLMVPLTNNIRTGKMEVAKKFVSNALSLSSSSIPDLHGACYNNLAVIDASKENYTKAIRNEKKGMAVLEKKVTIVLSNGCEYLTLMVLGL